MWCNEKALTKKLTSRSQCSFNLPSLDVPISDISLLTGGIGNFHSSGPTFWVGLTFSFTISFQHLNLKLFHSTKYVIIQHCASQQTAVSTCLSHTHATQRGKNVTGAEGNTARLWQLLQTSLIQAFTHTEKGRIRVSPCHWQVETHKLGPDLGFGWRIGGGSGSFCAISLRDRTAGWWKIWWHENVTFLHGRDRMVCRGEEVILYWLMLGNPSFVSLPAKGQRSEPPAEQQLLLIKGPYSPDTQTMFPDNWTSS